MWTYELNDGASKFAGARECGRTAQKSNSCRGFPSLLCAKQRVPSISYDDLLFEFIEN